MAGIVGAEHGSTGSDPLSAVLSLITDKGTFEKRIAELKSAQEQASSVLALVGPANEVLKARETIKFDLDKVKEALADARSQAAMLIHEARGRAAVLEEEAKALVVKQQEALAAARREAAEIVARANVQLVAAEATQKEAKQLGLVASQVKAQAEQDIKNAQAVKSSFEQQNATLKAVAEQFKAALGGV